MLAPLALALVMYSAVMTAVLRQNEWDPSIFVVAGESFTNRKTAPQVLSVQPDPGYDGQFYFRLALQPFSTEPEASGIRFDYPVYRQQRILYPLVAWLLSWGEPSLALWALILINLAAIGLLTAMASRTLLGVGLHPLWGLAVPLYAGFLLTFTRDLGEIVEVSLLFAAIESLQRRRIIRSVVFLSLATLAKEPAILFCAGPLLLAASHRFRTREDRLRLLFLIPPLVHFSWKQWLFNAWDIAPSLSLEPFAVPFTAFADALSAAPIYSFQQIELILLVAFVGIALPALWKSRLNVEIRIAWCAFAAMACTLGGGFWMEDWAFLRALAEFSAVGILLTLSGARWQRIAVFLLASTTWLLLVSRLVSG